MLRSKMQWLIGLVVCVLITSYFHKGNRINGIIWSDQEGYYIYLPALFIDGYDKTTCVNGCRTIDTQNGPRVFTKYTYGVALLESPFFLVGHMVAAIFNKPMDGRSAPYIWSILMAAIFYMLAGIAILSKLLNKTGFSIFIQWLVPVGLLLGTNLFYYTFRESGMSHVFSFFLISVLCYSSHMRLKSSNWRWIILTAFPLALIILIRPTNAIAGLIPLFWGAGIKDIPNRIWRFATDVKWLVAFLVSVLILFPPQLLYWKMVTDRYIFYSYGNEGFSNWNNPKILEVLFSHQNGWLIYSPIMVLGLGGLIFMMARKIKGWLMPTMLISIATYIFASWWAWWFGGAYGHRCYVDFLPIFAIPSAHLLSSEFLNKKASILLMALFAALVSYVNLRMCYIYYGPWDGSEWTWYTYLIKMKQVFFL